MSEFIDRDRAARMARQAMHVPGSAARNLTNWSNRQEPEGQSFGEWGNQFLQGLWSSHMSPMTRALVGFLGGGLFAYGLTQKAPVACILGTLGLALVTEAAANASIKEISHMPEQAADMASQAASGVADAASRAASGVANMASQAASGVAETFGFGHSAEHVTSAG